MAMVLRVKVASSASRDWKLWAGRPSAVRFVAALRRAADLVRIQREGDHRVVAYQRSQFDDAGRAVVVEDALVGRVTGVGSRSSSMAQSWIDCSSAAANAPP